ncbi:hypothetical protein [Kitasatospora azatica]|uniref:hypothetical protein n=1 Tax=Kitasatospora azatica TaxID=58347 RepID=UPI00068AC5E8|nr:hypothetical protein [Kitasatospora azatica]
MQRSSLRLKIEPCRRWIEEHYPDPRSCVLYVGIDATEPGRVPAITNGWQPYRVRYPLLEPPSASRLTKQQMLDWARAEGVEPPLMYALGFEHANCAGRCVRAGQAHWLHLLDVWPDQYAASQALEHNARALWGKDVAHLRATHARKSHPLTLAQLRRRREIREAFAQLPLQPRTGRSRAGASERREEPLF